MGWRRHLHRRNKLQMSARIATVASLLSSIVFASTLPAGGSPQLELASTGAYYVDSANGSDGADGLSPATAWRSLDRASRANLSAGQSLLLKHGSRWSGRLTIPWSGITVAPYGSGAMPVITNDGTVGSIVDIQGDDNIVAGLEVRSTSPDNGYLSGFNVSSGADRNTLVLTKASGAYAGVYINEGATRNKVTQSLFADNTMLNITPRDDAGAFGILIWGSYNEVSYNQIDRNAADSPRYGVDGSAIEIYNGSHNRVHHNRAHDNAAFAELGKDEGKTSHGNVFAYNVVTSSRTSVFLITRGAINTTYGPITSTRAYNNDVYLAGGIGVACNRHCDSTILTLRNNIVWAPTPLLVDATFDESHNLFWRTGGGLVLSGLHPTSMIANPRFVERGTDLHLRSDSPAIDAGSGDRVRAESVVDFDGTRVHVGHAVDIGAYEFRP